MWRGQEKSVNSKPVFTHADLFTDCQAPGGARQQWGCPSDAPRAEKAAGLHLQKHFHSAISTQL